MKLTIEWEGGSKHIFHSAPSMYIENKDKHKMKSIHIEESPVKELTDEEIMDCIEDKTGYSFNACDEDLLDFARAILRKAQKK
jgi:hypothetical protein